MSTPDQQAATYVPDDERELTFVGQLTDDDLDSIIEIRGVTGKLAQVTQVDENNTHLLILEEGRPFELSVTVDPGTAYVLIEPPVTEPADVVDMTDFYAKGRELDSVGKRITALEAEVDELKKRKGELSEILLGTFAKVGERRLYFDDRRAYIFDKAYPEFKTREDGTRFSLRDLVPVLESLGREDQIQPRTVNYNTLLGILAELSKGDGIPDEVAALVELKHAPEVRVGVGAKSKR